MSFAETVALGALAGFTIYLGLPFGRLQLLGQRTRVLLAMFSVGVLAFLLIDVLGHALETVEHVVEDLREGETTAGHAIGYTAMLLAGFAAGSAGLAAIEQWLRARNASLPPMAGGAVDTLTADAAQALAIDEAKIRMRALRYGMTIAAAIGLHNFAEGLAMGVASSSGEIALATMLIVGFALHNATEGFGIIGPLGNVRPSWKWLALAGLVGGGPTFLGTVVGYSVDSEPLELAFYAVSGGAILYVIGEVWTSMRRYGHRVLGLCVLAAGLTVGVLTELVIVYGGG
jgi:zinc transporter, ZIP family